ncbi:MAG: ATP-binding protein [Rhodomicrobium sp.]
MLLEFTIKNYRSIAQRQKLSMVAEKAAPGRNRIATHNSLAPYALSSASILGPNASGKTNLVRAFQFFQNFVLSSAKDRTEGEEIEITPFKLKPDFRTQPSEFEIKFVTKNYFYQYGFSIDRNRVWGEWLFSRPSSPGVRMRELFQREYDKDTGTYDWQVNENFVKGERETWKSATRDNALFLSTAILLNSRSLIEPYQWIRDGIRYIRSPEGLSGNFSAKKCMDESYKNQIVEFLKSTDLGVRDIAVKEEEATFPEIEKIFTEDVINYIKTNRSMKKYEVSTIHSDSDGDNVEFSLNDESAGTIVLFNLASPFLDVLSYGRTLIVDELDSSLHPHALRHLVELFNRPETNKNGAQLIFTTHDATILAGGVLNRDQIWLIERGKHGGTHLFPLSDFSIREGAAYERSYLSGKFGALPKIRDFGRVEK